jgi:DNA-binding phage protein
MNTRHAQTEKNRPVATPFQELVTKRVQQEPKFAAALLEEALERLVANDVVTAQLLLRDVVNGTIGFKALASATGLMEKSLMRMLSAKGNPQAKNLFNIIHALQQLNDVNLVITASPRKKKGSG